MNPPMAIASAAIWPRTASVTAAALRDARRIRINNEAANGSSGTNQKFAAAQEITLILFLLFLLQAGNALDRFVVNRRKFQAFLEPLDPFLARLQVQSMTG